MFVIGITGGTGSGKTTALETVRALGGAVIDCDEVYHGLLATDKDLLEAIEEAFPGTVEDYAAHIRETCRYIEVQVWCPLTGNE